jgi:hypothetical protein
MIVLTPLGFWNSTPVASSSAVVPNLGAATHAAPAVLLKAVADTVTM